MPRLKHLLIRGVNWLGDAIMTLPALQRLREAHPHTRFTLLTHEKLADLWRGQPIIDHVMEFKDGDSPRAIGRRLRREDIQAALILPNSTRAALETWCARIPRRIGYAARWRRLFLTETLPTRPGHMPMHKPDPSEIERRLANDEHPRELPPTAHHIHHYLHLAATLGADPDPVPPQIIIPIREIVKLEKKFKLPPDTKRLAIIPGAEYGPAKRWPAAQFAATAKLIHEQHKTHTLLLGGPADQAIANEIAATLQPETVTDLTGRTTLRELAAALAASHCVLTNDTGPMHLAAAVDAPVVALFGSTNPGLTAPGLPGHGKIQILRTPPPCAPCFLRQCPIDTRCLKNITVESVTTTIERIL